MFSSKSLTTAAQGGNQAKEKVKTSLSFILTASLTLVLGQAAVAQLAIPYIASSALPAIDGELSDWEALFGPPHLTQAQFVSTFGEVLGALPADDQKIDVWLGWNAETNLIYLAARVVDNAWGTTSSEDPAFAWRSDAMEVYIDADNSGGPYNRTAAHAQQYVLNPAGKYGAVLFAGGELLLLNPPTVTSAARRSGSIYTYELAIPGWDSIDPTGTGMRHVFQRDHLLGLTIAFPDFESAAAADGTTYHAFNGLYGPVGAYQNADPFTDFRLAGRDGGTSVLPERATPPDSRLWALPQFTQPPVLDGIREAAEWAGALEAEYSVSQVLREGAAYGWRDRENQVSEVSANQLSQSAGEEETIARTDADASFYIWCAWDDEALYYLAEVRDNVHDVTGGGEAWAWWERDSISLYVDLTNTKEKGVSGVGPYTALNIINFAAVEPYSGTLPIAWERTWERTLAAILNSTNDPDLMRGMQYGYRFARDEFGGAADYVIEGKIPWEVLRQFNLPAVPEVGTQMGFSWLLVDPDGEEGYGGQLQGGGLVDDPSTYSTWVFADTPAGPAPGPSPPDVSDEEGGGIVPLAEPPPPVTLVSAQKYATLQEALDKERALYIPPHPSGGHYELNESLVIEGWEDGIIVGSGRLGNSGTRLFFKGDHGLRIHNCRRLTLYNLSLAAWETGPEGAVIEITGDEPCEIHLVNLNIGEVIPGTTRGAALRVRAPAQVIIERCFLGGVDVGLEVDHPEANVVLVGGSVWARAVCIRQLAGHLEAYSLDVGNTYDLPDGVDFELNRASWKPFVIAGARTERSALGIRTPETSERIDLTVKAFSLPDEKLYDYGFMHYEAAGTVALIGNASTRGKIEVPTGTGRLWSVGNHLGRAYEAGEPYHLNREAHGIALADLWQAVPSGEPLSAFITPEELRARNRPVPENVQFLASGATVPPLNTSSALQIADVPVIANIAEFLPSVKDYGATGDGVTDDTEALQRAIDANQGMWTSPNLFFPPGVYHISRPLLLENRNYGGWWVGAGKDLTTIINTAGGGVVRTNGCGYATFQDLSFVAVEGGSEPVFDLFLDRQRNPERQGIQANLFARCRFVGGSIGLSIAQGEWTMGSENMMIDCEFLRCKVGLEVGNFNALNNNVVRCLFQDNEVALSQQAGSFYVFDSRLEKSKDTDLWLRNADCFYVQNTTSNSPSLLRTPNTGAVINVVFDHFRYLGDQPINLISYNAGGSVVFLDSDLGKGFLSGAGYIANKSIVLAGTHFDLPNVFNLSEGARGFLLNFSADGGVVPAVPVLIAPVNGVAGAKTYPMLWWKRAAGATAYRLQVATDASFAAPIVDQRHLTAPFYEAEGLGTATTYYWRVGATNAEGASDWSEAWRFTTSATGDFDGSGKVDFSDFFLFADAFGGVDPRFDLDSSGRVEFADFFLFADFFGSEARAKLMTLAQEHLGLPISPRLEQNYPNPFNSSTMIRYQVAEPGLVRLDLFSLTGQKVKTLIQGFQTAGAYQVSWDGDDEQGTEVATGIYLARLQAGDFAEVKKMILLK